MLTLLLAQSSIFLISIYKIILDLQAVRMKSSKSQKNISIITDRRLESEYIANRDRGSSKGFQTCKNQTRTIINHIPQPMSCKNLTEEGEINQNRSRSASAQKHKRQRSTSLQSRQQAFLGQENRKKQLDYLCFQRLINIFKKYLLQRQENWNLQALCYGQLLKLLWLCRFVPYSVEQQFIENNEQSELKKAYLLWLSIAYKKYINFKDFLNFVQIIQNINVQQQKIDSLMFSLESEIKGLCFKKYESTNVDPNFTFFLKRIELKRTQSHLIFDEAARETIQTQFKSFKLNKLKNSGLFQCVKVQQPQVLVSKKSTQLAENKRKKIEEKIRQKKPHVENINLLDLLSYRQRDHLQSKKTQVPPKKKSIVSLKRGELKKEIQFLSKPKTHFEQRKQDQIQFQKEQEQYTFHPKINMYKLNSQQKVMQVKNVDKVLVRMKQARKQKQEKQNIMQKGWCNLNKAQNKQTKPFGKNKKYHQMISLQKQNINTQKQVENPDQMQKRDVKLSKYEVSKDYLRIPILYIDVNIEEGKKQRIIIYDSDKAQTLASQFGQKHKLSQETIKRLEMLLQQQMDTVLARIDEQTDDECSILY